MAAAPALALGLLGFGPEALIASQHLIRERISGDNIGGSEREYFSKIGRFKKSVVLRAEQSAEYRVSYPFSHLSVPLL